MQNLNIYKNQENTYSKKYKICKVYALILEK